MCSEYSIKTQVPSSGVLPYENCDFESGVDVVMLCSIPQQFLQQMGSASNNPSVLFRCKHAVLVGILDLKEQLCILLCFVLPNDFFWCSNRAYSVIPLQLIAASFICWIQVGLQLLGIFGTKHVCFFTFAASPLQWICAFFLINITIQDSCITGTKMSFFSMCCF